MSGRVYLDFNAGAPLRPEARAAALEAMEAGGNASSVHAAGRAARERIEAARRSVAALVGAAPEAVLFTSGGAEANALALTLARDCGGVIASPLEHSTVLAAARAADVPVHTLEVTPDGRVDLDALEARLKAWRGAPPFVAVMAASHETGAIQPVREAAELVRARGGRLHVDAVAAAGRTLVDFKTLGVDSLAVSGHKLGALAGAGALIVDPRLPVRPLIAGGGQERGLRAGTENLAGIASLGAAAACSLRDLAGAEAAPAARAARALEARLAAAGGVVVAASTPRTPQVACVAFEGFASHLQVMALDLEGVMVSAGAACASGRIAPSEGLRAMGLGALAGSAIRASGGWSSAPGDWERFGEALVGAAERRRARGRRQELV